MTIFLKIAAISVILSIVCERIIFAIKKNATMMEYLTDDYGIGYYICVCLWIVFNLSAIVCGILSIIFWK